MTGKPTYEELEKKIQKFEQAESEYKQAEDTQIKSERRYKNDLDAIDSIGVGVFIVDHDYRIRFMNKTMIKWFGAKTGLNCHQSIAGLDSPCSYCQIKTVIDSGKTINYKPTIPDGRSFVITCSPTCNSDGSISKIEIIQDITEDKKAAKMLQRSEALLKTTQQLAKVGGWEWDVKEQTMFWTDEVYRIHGFQQSEFQSGSSKHIELSIECYEPEDRSVIMAAFKNCVEKGQPYDLEFPFTTINGRRIWIRTIAKPIRENGTIVKAIGNIIDISDHKQAEEILKESEERFRKIYHNMAVGVAQVSLEFQIKRANKAYCSMIGYREEELIGKHLSEITHPEILEENLWKQSQLISGQIDHYRLEKQFIHKNNDVIHGILDANLVRNSEGKPLYFLGSVVDITERKKIEKELKKSQEKYRALAEECPISIMTFNHEGLVTFVNKWHLKIFAKLKHKSEFFIGKKITELPGLVSAKIIPDLEKVLQGKTVVLEDVYFPEFTGGHSGYQSIKAVPTYKKGEVVGGILIREDATQRKHAEDALRKSEEKYRSMMESMKDAAYICSSELHIEYMNPTMVDRVGTDVTGEICHKALYDQDEKCSWCVFDQIKKGENVDYEVADPKDSRYYSVSNSPIFNADQVISKLTIFHDITEIKDIEAQLQQSRKMESIGTLAGGIAHDFNNLLYMISGNAELALEDIPKWNPVHTNLEEIKSASLRAAGIVKQLLNFSRKTDQKLKPIGAVTIIKDALKFLRSTIPTTIDIREHLPEEDMTILADPVQINQVLMNLCINASQAMEETGGILEITVENESLSEKSAERYSELTAVNYLKITVNDTGPGIAAEIIDRIFDPYFTTKEMGKGSGMGLSIVHGIVKNHDGAISVDSKPGKGTTFSILFPVVDEKPKMETETINEIPRGHETILFVDDEEAITNMTGQMLKRLGYRVATSLNPVEALELFKSKPDTFDLVITDMTMPQMTGAKLSKKLMEIRSDIPVIICTGHSSLINEENAKQLGIAGFVMKPASMSRIAKAIREVLDK